MKKFLILFLTAVLLLPAFIVNTSARIIEPNDPIDVGIATPVIDGNITYEEGWSMPAILNRNTMTTAWSTAPQVMDGRAYFAYCAEGLYYAADINDPLGAIYYFGDEATGAGFVYSTGPDTIDDDYGFNGDIFGFMFDINDMFINAGYTSNRDRTPWYLVGIFEGEEGEGDVVRMYREYANSGEITDLVQLAGTTTDDGWRFEAFIPWDIIVEDAKVCSDGEIVYDREMLSSGNFTMKSSCLYQDRFFDTEQGAVDTWSRYISVSVYGAGTSCDQVSAYGLELNFTTHKIKNLIKGDEPTEFSCGKIETYCTECKEKLNTYNRPVDNALSEFDDVMLGQWYSESIRYCELNQFMKGVDERLFNAAGTLTREQVVQILYNISHEEPEEFTNTRFTDVESGAWYESAVTWAAENGVTKGISETEFGIGKTISRQEVVTLLYNYTKFLDIYVDNEGDYTTFDDADEVAEWAADAMNWAIDLKVITGTSETTLSPTNTTTRREAAALIERYVKNIIG
ncbi:MAG: S-layer homology domain-containing protein [Clostridia bacterium]|nr:S-layer homology domain-containing protein [Clostridia bacterium]